MVVDQMPMTPTAKRSFDLNIFKKMRRFITRVLRYPTNLNRADNLSLNNGARTNN